MLTLLLCTVLGSPGPWAEIHAIEAPKLVSEILPRPAGMFARMGPEDYGTAILSEDGDSAWTYASSGLGGHLWSRYVFAKRAFAQSEELFHFLVEPSVGSYTTSQSTYLPPRKPDRNRKKQEFHAGWGAVLVALSGAKVIVTSGPLEPTGLPDTTRIIIAPVNAALRPKTPPLGAMLPMPLENRGTIIGAKWSGRALDLVEAWRDRMLAYRYDANRHKLTIQRDGPTRVFRGAPVTAQRYDFTGGNVFYDLVATPEGKRLLEWQARAKAWKTFAPPPGRLGPAFYWRGSLFAEAWQGETCHLYHASADRRAWTDVGPYLVLARNAGETRWLLQTSPTGKLSIATWTAPSSSR